MAQFDATTSAEHDRLVVVVSGECDLSVRERLTSVLLDAVGRSPLVVVDLAAVSFLDSSGIHALVTAYHAANDDGRKLYVVNPVGVVANVLDVTGVAELLRLPDGDRHDA